MPQLRVLVFLVSCLTASIPLLAQPGTAITQYDIPIKYFYVHGPADSFLFYSAAKASLARQQDDLGLWLTTRMDVADFFYENEQYESAAQYLDETWAGKWREPRNEEEWGLCCYIQSNRGTDLAQAGKMMQSIAAFQEAASIYERFRFEDFDPVEFIYKPLGNCYTRLGDDDKALAVFFKTLMLPGDNETMAGVYCNIGIAYWNKSDYEAAEKYQRQGLGLSGVSRVKRALLLGALAQVLLDKGQLLQAQRSADESLQLLAPETPKGLAQEYRCYSRRTAGIARLRQGRLAEAARLLQGARSDALQVFGPHSRDLGKIYIALAELSLLQKNAAAALDAANRALSAVLHSFQPIRPEENPRIVSFYEENVIFEALAMKAAAAQLAFEQSGSPGWLVLALDCHDLAWKAETRQRKVFQYHSSKLNLQNSSRAREEAAMRVARLLFEKTGDARYLDKAFAIAERSKAALLSEAMQDNLVRQRLAESDRRFSELNTLRQHFSAFEKQMLLHPDDKMLPQWRSEADALAARINALESALAGAYPQLVEQQLATAQDAQNNLQAGETLVEYFAGPAHIEAFVFQANKAALWFSFENSRDLQTLAGQYLAYFENQNAILNDPQGYFKVAYKLWQKLLPPELAKASIISIVPDGFLNFIPFDALVTAAPEAGTTLRNAAYLIRTQQVRHAWSLSVLQQQKKLTSKADNYALCLAPGFSKGERGLTPLQSPATERPSGSKVLSNESADVEGFTRRAGMYRLLHLSTHAFATPVAGQLPRLELFDQPLYLPSIYALPLQADLVTLSACQTGLGQVQSGEGVMSLARAFAQAGAACVVSSLWSVNDRSTSQLLSGFYRSLENGRSIGQSLRESKLAYIGDAEVRAAMQSPYFWAGLVMVGDDRVVAAGTGWWPWIAGLALAFGVGLWWWLRRQKLPTKVRPLRGLYKC
jgi:CHAT domain-containing protein